MTTSWQRSHNKNDSFFLQKWSSIFYHVENGAGDDEDDDDDKDDVSGPHVHVDQLGGVVEDLQQTILRLHNAVALVVRVDDLQDRL